MKNRFAPLGLLVFLIWMVYLADAALRLGLARFGIRPRAIEGLIGVVSWPFLHGNWAHIVNNSISLILFGGIIAGRSRRTFMRLTAYVVLLAGAGVWLVGRNAIHIGASGLAFGYFGYIVTRGFYDRSYLSVVLSAFVIVIFGSLVWGVFPSDPYISWEGHLCGLVTGSVYSSYSRRTGYR